MRRHGWHQQQWSTWSQWEPTGPDAWWPDQGSGWAWRGFARRIFIGLVLFFGLGMVSLILIGAALSSLFGSGWAAFLAPIVVIVVGVLGARWVLRTWRPVGRLMRATATLADGDYSVRVDPEGGAASLRPVVASFNDMAHRLETAAEERRRLLADLGHELRTPLTVIRGEIEAMLDGVHTPDEAHLDLLLDEVTVMERLLEDLRTLSLAEAGALALHRESTDLVDLVADVADSYRRAAESQRVSILVEEGGAMPDVMVDPVRIREILTNLIVNALRAMPDGGRLTLILRREQDVIRITVQDTGVGIASDVIDRVFDRFQKGSSSQGSGLGLTISRDLTEAHGGTIAIASTPGAGTSVTITLPFLRPPDSTEI